MRWEILTQPPRDNSIVLRFLAAYFGKRFMSVIGQVGQPENLVLLKVLIGSPRLLRILRKTEDRLPSEGLFVLKGSQSVTRKKVLALAEECLFARIKFLTSLKAEYSLAK